MDSFPLSGAMCVSTHFLSLTRSRAISEAGFFPFSGDVRLDVRIDPAVWSLPEGPDRCRGSCVLSVFDGDMWRPFDITSVTTCFKFQNADQLRAIQSWLRHALETSAGRMCTWFPSQREGAKSEGAEAPAGMYRLPAPQPAVVTRGSGLSAPGSVPHPPASSPPQGV